MSINNGGHRYKLIQAMNILDNAMKEVRESSPETLHKSCVNCQNWHEYGEYCTRFNNERPPAKVIAFGCIEWINVDEDLPF